MDGAPSAPPPLNVSSWARDDDDQENKFLFPHTRRTLKNSSIQARSRAPLVIISEPSTATVVFEVTHPLPVNPKVSSCRHLTKDHFRASMSCDSAIVSSHTRSSSYQPVSHGQVIRTTIALLLLLLLVCCCSSPSPEECFSLFLCIFRARVSVSRVFVFLDGYKDRSRICLW